MDSYKDLFSVDNKNALVVGAGGLGKAIASGLLQNGCNVAIASRDINKINAFIKDEGMSNKNLVAIETDILNNMSVEEMINSFKKEFPTLDILINAAGMNILKKAEDYDENSWDKVINLNVKGVHLVTKAAGKIMIAQKYGRIVNISSVRGSLGFIENYLAYCTSKGAINMYTKQIACEWAKYGITCNAVAPTFVRTPINSFQLDNPDFYNRLISRIPLGRIGTPKDVVAAVIYLCSDAASFVTGQILGIDGGLTAIQ